MVCLLDDRYYCTWDWYTNMQQDQPACMRKWGFLFSFFLFLVHHGWKQYLCDKKWTGNLKRDWWFHLSVPLINHQLSAMANESTSDQVWILDACLSGLFYIQKLVLSSQTPQSSPSLSWEMNFTSWWYPRAHSPCLKRFELFKPRCQPLAAKWSQTALAQNLLQVE